MSKASKWISVILAVILLVLIGLIAALRISHRLAQRALPEDSRLTLRQQTDGALRLSWPAVDGAAAYYLEVAQPQGDGTREETLLFSARYEATECILPTALPDDQPLMLRVTPLKDVGIVDQEVTRFASAAISVSCYLNVPRAELVSAEVDADTATVRLAWSGWKGDRYRLLLAAPDGTRTLLWEQEQIEAELRFGETPELPVPPHGESVRLIVEPLRETPQLRFLGLPSEFAVTRNDFLGSALHLQCEETGENAFTLRWNETRGAGYQILRRAAGQSAETVLATFGPADERVYHTGHLDPCTEYSFRVVAFHEPGAPEQGDAAEPDAVTVQTGPRLLYSTVWALQDIPIYAAPGGGEKLGVMRADTAYCVLGEENGYLQIATPAMSGYVDGGQCMIDLNDFLGPLCAYDISNSYSSMYRVHEYDIPKVSGTVVEGYEDVRLSYETYLVPLLYPSAKKLIAAAETAAQAGYRLKLYDTFRPNRATRSIYDLTSEILSTPLPERTFHGERTEPGPDGDMPTYAQLMTNQYFGLGSFLASSASRHNYGVAMDLTLETLGEGAELPMQTSMHDLSWYSSIARNNENANLLREIMTGSGFGGLSSEWWHFQDNEAYAAKRLACRWDGVEPVGWRLDDNGWRYRQADGSFLRDTEAQIDGSTCRFGPDGYLLGG